MEGPGSINEGEGRLYNAREQYQEDLLPRDGSTSSWIINSSILEGRLENGIERLGIRKYPYAR